MVKSQQVGSVRNSVRFQPTQPSSSCTIDPNNRLSITPLSLGALFYGWKTARCVLSKKEREQRPANGSEGNSSRLGNKGGVTGQRCELKVRGTETMVSNPGTVGQWETLPRNNRTFDSEEEGQCQGRYQPAAASGHRDRWLSHGTFNVRKMEKARVDAGNVFTLLCSVHSQREQTAGIPA